MDLLLEMKIKNPLLKMRIEAAPNFNACCRICLDAEPIQDLIQPCLCSGSMAYVHADCLHRWLEETTNPENKINCSVCKFKYLKTTPPTYFFRDFCQALNRGNSMVVGTLNVMLFNFFLTYILFGFIQLFLGLTNLEIQVFHVQEVTVIYYFLMLFEFMYAWWVSKIMPTMPLLYMIIWGGSGINAWVFAPPEVASLFALGIVPVNALISITYLNVNKTLLSKVSVRSLDINTILSPSRDEVENKLPV